MKTGRGPVIPTPMRAVFAGPTLMLLYFSRLIFLTHRVAVGAVQDIRNMALSSAARRDVRISVIMAETIRSRRAWSQPVP